MEEAYDIIEEAIQEAATSIVDVIEGLEEVLVETEVLAENVAVSNVFDISVESDADDHGHKAIKITLEIEDVDNFLALVHYTNNAWEIVETVLDKENKTLSFSVDDLSPFAILVDNTKYAEDSEDAPVVDSTEDSEDVPVLDSTEDKTEDSQAGNTVVDTPVDNTPSNTDDVAPKKGMHPAVIVLIVVLALGAVAGGVLFVLKKKKKA